MDGITPRGLIDRVLDTRDVDQTTRVPTGRTRSQITKTPPVSQSSPRKKKTKRQSPLLTAVDTDTTTPRTMIEEFMQDHDTIHQSMHKRPRLQPSPEPASPRSRSPNVSLSGSSNKSLTRSLHKKATMKSLLQHSKVAEGPTPRTMIQGLLAQAPEETPVAVSQRSNKDLEESILPSLSGHVSREKSLLEQDSEAGNSFLDAYLAASQPVTSSAPSSASRPTRTRQRVVSKADFADAVKQTIAVLEQEEESVHNTADIAKAMSQQETTTPEKIRELVSSAGLQTTIVLSPDVSAQILTSSGDSDAIQSPVKDNAMNRSSRSEIKAFNRSRRLKDRTVPKEKTMNESSDDNEDEIESPVRDKTINRSLASKDRTVEKDRTRDESSNDDSPDEIDETTRSKNRTFNKNRRSKETVNRSSRSRDMTMHGHSDDDSADESPTSRSKNMTIGNETVDRSVRSNNKAMNRGKGIKDRTMDGETMDKSVRLKNEAMNRSKRLKNRTMDDETMNKSERPKDVTMDGSSDDESPAETEPPTSRSKDRSINRSDRTEDKTMSKTSRSRDETINKSRYLSQTEPSLRRSPRTPSSLTKTRKSPRLSSSLKAKLTNTPSVPSAIETPLSSPRRTSMRKSLGASRSRRSGSFSNTASSGRHETPSSSSRKSRTMSIRETSSPVSSRKSRTPTAYQKSIADNVVTITPRAAAPPRGTTKLHQRSISAYIWDKTPVRSPEGSIVEASDSEERGEVMIGQVVDESHLEISHGELGNVHEGEIVSVQPLHGSFAVDREDAEEQEEKESEDEENQEEQEQKNFDTEDEGSDDEEEENQKQKNHAGREQLSQRGASKRQSLFEQRTRTQSITMNDMIRVHYDQLHTPVLQNRTEPKGDGTPLTPFQRLMRERGDSQPGGDSASLTPYQKLMRGRGKTSQQPPSVTHKAKTSPAAASTGNKGRGRSRQQAGHQPPRLPSALTKSIFTHFLGKNVSKDTLAQIEKVGDTYWKNVAGDLKVYLQHAGKVTVDEADVNLLMKRQRIVTEKKSMYRLVEEYLPLQYQCELIPCAKAGNVVTPKNGLYS